MTDPEKATIGDLFSLMTSIKKEVDGLADWRVSMSEEARASRERLRSLEQQSVAMFEQTTLIHARLDGFADRMDRIESKLDGIMAPAE